MINVVSHKLAANVFTNLHCMVASLLKYIDILIISHDGFCWQKYFGISIARV